jgi:hypothetical protein
LESRQDPQIITFCGNVDWDIAMGPSLVPDQIQAVDGRARLRIQHVKKATLIASFP